MILEKPTAEIMKEITKEFACGCEVCSQSAAICPATAYSYVEEIACLRRNYDLLVDRCNRLEHIVGSISMLLRKDMTS